MAEVSSCDTDHVACKAQNTCHLVREVRKVSGLLLYLSSDLGLWRVKGVFLISQVQQVTRDTGLSPCVSGSQIFYLYNEGATRLVVLDLGAHLESPGKSFLKHKKL